MWIRRLMQLSPVLLAAICVFVGSLIDAAVKGLAATTPVLIIMAWRFFFGGVLSLGLFLKADKPLPSRAALRFHFMRGAIQLTSAVLFFWSLTQLGLAEATTIGFTAALMLGPVGWIILGERLTLLSLVAALIGFAGAVWTVTGVTSGAPETGNRLLGALAALIAAFLYALTLVLLRLRSRQEDAITLVMFTNVFPGLILLPVLIFSLPETDFTQIPFFAGLSLMGVTVWWLFTIAYSRAPAQRLAPLEYTALIWSAGLGFVFFGEVPSWQLMAGAMVIIGACFLVVWEEKTEAGRSISAPRSDLPD